MFLKSGSESLPRFHKVLAWLQRKRKGLFNGLFSIIKHTPGLGSYFQGVHSRYQEVVWRNKAIKVTADVESLVPEEATFILVDEGDFIRKGFSRRKSIAFLERDGGQYWGPPDDDAEAIQELEMMRQQGATFLVVLWPAFWWLEYYKEWDQYIRSKFHCIEENERIMVFDIK